MMKIEYNADGDVLMIYLRDGEYSESVEVAPDIIVDFDKQGAPLAIEILNARQVLGVGNDALRLEVPVILNQTA